MDILKTKAEMQTWSAAKKRQGKSIAFVPTMGYLHKGHVSLLEIGKPLSDELVLSIFVNPTQFGPNEDLDAYPSNIQNDLDLAEQAGVTAVFLPDKNEMYGPDYQTHVYLDHLPRYLCGRSRPIHFGGVATVVTKLFNIVMPDVAVFGKKDFQQLAVIRQMVKDLDFNIRIIGGEIIRETDGLAMSSRNAYLTPAQRASAVCLSRAINLLKQRVDQGVRSVPDLVREAESFILSFDHTRIDYIELCHPRTLEPVDTVQSETLLALAVQVGKSRLIDNALIGPT
ncbi:pantoate--beta-alanine ligase [Desulfobacter latus]|uniref:Pantothenate synthetase n=1 Tax=Desulfobacter latus TaxID=2292 RepID=A0A850TBC8_9BACT|nr:pantoate--beta-alanine ligase [Desulfobacter latus]NWH05537.1 pantoate--beta-alanine ligase [Desulfobacter latus]